MKALRARKPVFAALAALFLLCGGTAFAQKAADRLLAYEAAISSGNPAAAAAFLKDREAFNLSAADDLKGPELLGKAEALKDLKDLLAMPWDKEKANKLNGALSIRIDVNKPLAKVGVGPEPEKLLAWLEKYQPSYPQAKKAVVKTAIRQWEVVFGTMTDLRKMSWDQASMRQWRGVTVTKDSWGAMVISERNAVIAQLMKQDQSFIIYSDQALAAKKDAVALQASVDKVKASGTLTPEQLAQLSGKSLADQAYLLGNFFDGGAARGDADMARIQASRNSLPKEVLPTQQRDLLGGMMGPAVSKELDGTKAGQRVLAFYAKEGPMKIVIRPVDGKYSEYDPATRTIVLDSETIQQYMRMKGYTADSVMRSPEQVAEIAKYMSPAVVYESAHQMQDSWARKKGVYKPHVQEDEIEAMSLEGLYTSEKLRKDKAFRGIMDSSRGFSSYAAKRVDIATEFAASGSKKFATTVRQRYFSSLPSLDAAASQVLSSVSDELARRASLTVQERAQNDTVNLTLQEAMEMTPEELAGSVGEIRTDALAKIERDLSSLGVYKSRYTASDRESRKALKTLKTSAGSKSAAPPAL
jgi:hypothetical protein